MNHAVGWTVDRRRPWLFGRSGGSAACTRGQSMGRGESLGSNTLPEDFFGVSDKIYWAAKSRNDRQGRRKVYRDWLPAATRPVSFALDSGRKPYSGRAGFTERNCAKRLSAGANANASLKAPRTPPVLRSLGLYQSSGRAAESLPHGLLDEDSRTARLRSAFQS